MREDNFWEVVSEIIQKDPRYPAEAYEFVRNAVTYTTVKLGRHKNKKSSRHVNGKELLTGIADYAKEQFGPLAADVLENWGLKNGVSIGNVVFNMVERSLLSATEEDSINDFNVEFDFDAIFRKPYLESEQKKKNINPPIIA